MTFEFKNYKIYLIAFFCILLIVVLCANLINYYINGFTKTITVKDKYITSVAAAIYTIADSNNTIYQIKNVWFIGDFDKVENYNFINVGGTYKVKGYGFRFDMFGIYPTIYDVEKV